MSPFWRKKLLSIQVIPKDFDVIVEIQEISNKISRIEVCDLLGYSVPSIITHQFGVFVDAFSLDFCGKMLYYLKEGQMRSKPSWRMEFGDEDGLESHKSNVSEVILSRARIDLFKGKHGVYSNFSADFKRDAMSILLETEIFTLLQMYTLNIIEKSSETIDEKIRCTLLYIIDYFLEEALTSPDKKNRLVDCQTIM